MTLSDEQIQDLLRVGNPTDDECRLIRMGWDAAMRKRTAVSVPEGWKLVPIEPTPSVPTALLVAVADLVAQMEIVSRVGFVDTPNDKDSCAAFCIAEGTWLELMSCVESLAASLAAAPETKRDAP